MKFGRRPMPVCLLMLCLVPVVSAAEPEASKVRLVAEDLPNVLAHRGVPNAAEDWTFAPFSDQGAWFGMALPPDDQHHLRGGFSGPFLMTHGRWLSPQLAGFEMTDADTGTAVPFAPATEPSSRSFPGRLSRSFMLDGIRVEQDLWFDETQLAVVRVRWHNLGEARRLTFAWTGSLFADQGRFQPAEGGLDVYSETAGAVFHIRLDREGFETDKGVEDQRYRLNLAEPVTLPAGGSTSFAVTLSMTVDGTPGSGARVRALDADRIEGSSDGSRARWQTYLDAVDLGTGADNPRQILAVKAMQTLVNNWRGPAGRMAHSGMFPSSNVNYFNGFWAWDSWKHAVGTLVFDPELAKEQVRSMFAHQDEHGMIADVVYLDADEDNWRDTKPPLAGWAIEAVYRATGDTAFVRELYPKLKTYHEFWYRDRDHDGDGLCEYGSTDGTLVAARWESGMDNAVRYDNTKMVKNSSHAWSMNQESVDLNSYLYREKLALAELAAVLGKTGQAERFRADAEVLRKRIQETFFDPETGWFYDTDIESGDIVPVQSPEGWTPLWTGAATPEQAARVRKGMLDPTRFRTHLPFPTVSRAHGEFSEGYWRGLVWIDQVYFAIEGLRRYGFDADAEALTEQVFQNLDGAVVPGRPLHENYNALTGEGRNVKHFSWTAAHLLLLATGAE